MMTFLLSGCWDFQRMRDRMFISGIAVDKEDDGYIVGVESLNLHSGGGAGQQQGNENESKVTIEKVNYPSIEIPLHSLQTKVNGDPFYSNIQVLIIGKRQAEDGIAGIISHFLRDPDMRRTTPVVFSENPIDLMKVKQKDQRFVSEYIKELIKLTEETGRTITTDIGSISRAIHENNIEFIPNIKIQKNKHEMEVNGTSLLKKGKIVGSLNEHETTIVAYLKENTESGSLHMDCPQSGNGSVSMDMIHTSSSLKPRVENGDLIIGGHLKAKGYLAEYTCGDGSIQGKTTLNKLENEFTEILKKDVYEKLATIYKRTGEDVLNLQSIFEKDHPKTWEKIKPEFANMVKSPIIDINVSVDLILKGTES
ncbi:Ger(x)C family spore germination protein [Schinkia azotoformans]|nr:Ger(x)C family spore germination protein [Schinkia azotoformans]